MGLFSRQPDPNVVEALASQRRLIERLEGELVRSTLELADARKAQHAAEDGLKQAIEGLRVARAEFENRLAAIAVRAPDPIEDKLNPHLRLVAPRPAFANTSISAGHFDPAPPAEDKRRILGSEATS